MESPLTKSRTIVDDESSFFGSIKTLNDGSVIVSDTESSMEAHDES